MNIRTTASVVVAAFSLHAPRAPDTTYVGTVPCSESIRAFVGGIAPGTQCSAVMLRIDLGADTPGSPGWSMEAAYGSNTAANVGRMIDAPRILAHGRLERAGSTFRLVGDAGRSISFRQVSPALIHLLDAQGRLMLGTSGWSFTLNRSDATDDPGSPERIFGASYSLMPRATGSTVIGVFGGRTPCTSLLRAMHRALDDGCQRIKWRVTLFQDSVTRQPTRYRIEGSLHHTAREGELRVRRGTALDPDAVVYELAATATEGAMLFWKADDDVLFLLDEQRRPLVGTIDFSYTLSRSIP